MKTTLLPLIVTTLLLAACTPAGISIGLGGGTGGFGIGTNIHFPIGGNSQNQGGVRVIEEKIVTYFDSRRQPQSQPAKDGYYRELLAQRRGGLYLVQDFYESGARKRSDPMLIEKHQLFDFYAHPASGSHSVYYPSGRLASQTQYQDGKVIRSQTWLDQ